MQNTCPEIESLVDKLCKFVLANRNKQNKQKVFKDWNYKELEATFRQAILLQNLLYCVDECDNIIGVVHGVRDNRKKMFHVSNILTTCKTGYVLKRFIEQFDLMFEGYALYGNRYGNLKAYDTAKFKRRLKKHSIYARN